VDLTTAALRLASEAEQPSPLLPHLSELIVGLVAFTLLFLFLRAKVYPVFEKTFADRAAAIEGGLARAEAAQAEAADALARYNAQLAEARVEAGRIRTEAQSQRADIVEEARTEARAEAQRILASANAQIASERQQTITELRREIGGLAVELAGKVVGESLEDEARQRRTVERFLDGLDTTDASAPAGTA